MICDAMFAFGVPDITNSNSATVSPYVFDAGSAIKLFDGVAGGAMKVVGKLIATADDNPTVRVQLIGSDAAALNSNNIVLADKTYTYKADGSTALASGDTVEFELKPSRQQSAKRYYGLLFTMGGTNPDCVAATGHAHLVMDAQNNMTGPRAATP